MKISGMGMTPLKHTGKLWNMAQWIRSPSSCFLALLTPYGTTVGCTILSEYCRLCTYIYVDEST